MGLKVLKLSLSTVESAVVVDAPETMGIKGLEGKLNKMKDGRLYYMAYFQDPENPFAPVQKRMMSQANLGEWKAGAPEQVGLFIGKTIKGSRIVSAMVEPYDLNGEVRDRYTTVVLPHETVESAFKPRILVKTSTVVVDNEQEAAEAAAAGI